MPVARDLSRLVDARLHSKLLDLGFEKQQSGIYTIPIVAKVVGWLGLNKAFGRGEALELNAVVGVRHLDVESLVSELLGEPPNKCSPPTLAGNIGYLMPENRYRAFVFASPDSILLQVDELCAAVTTYGLKFAHQVKDLAALVQTMETVQFGMPEQTMYRIPAGYLLLGEHIKAIAYVHDATVSIGSRRDPAAQRYLAFAAKLRNRIGAV